MTFIDKQFREFLFNKNTQKIDGKIAKLMKFVLIMRQAISTGISFE